jgi:LuxR family maltose regulon positive regulatory protein
VPAWIKPEVTHQQVRLNLAQENPAAAEAALRQAGVSPQDAPALLSGPAAEGAQSFPASLLALACLRLLAYRGQRGSPEDLAAGMELAGRFIASTTASGRVGMALQALLLRAAMHKALGSAEAGLEDIAAALALAEPEGYIRLFVDEGPGMSADLAEILQRVQLGQPPTAQPAYLQQLLAAFPAAAFPTPSAAEPQGQTALVDPLTERELEVLRLIASGLKYEEIAARLVITINTVRFYVKEIYSKLNVNNRTKAIELARQLKLIG